MSKRILAALRRVAPFLPCLPLILLAGCIPLGMSWLPDSSGFIYPAGNQAQQIMFYDAAKRDHRVLVADTGAMNLIPALSPDGTRIAVARIRRTEAQGETAQIVIYDRDGKETHQSPLLSWKDSADPEDGKFGAIVFWDREGKKIVFSAPLERAPQTGIYDPSSKKLQTLTGVLMPFGGTPIRPDNKGFLVIEGTDKPEVALVDWTGKKQKFQLDPETYADNDRRSMLGFPWWYASQWYGDTARVSYDGWRIQLDAKKFAAKAEKRPVAEARIGNEIVQQQYQFAGGVKVRGLITEPAEGKQPKSRLEILIPGADKPRIVVEDAKGAFGFAASPNKKLLAIWCVDDGSGNPYVYVVNSDGELVSATVVQNR